ncbi:MAG TPA: SMP-30/gluconolactonase/LRE family protein, partial [Polyangiales bacterium]|nr:SMP-30/gluconolactonase/LRE family protein [Polyangiales bacterium]
VISEGPDWGDARCPGPPDKHFSPHGIDLKRRADGRLSLFAVNHGREAIEIFEIDPESYGAMWRGCVPMPEGTNLNDVTALPDGGFATTHAFPHSQGLAQLWYLAKATLGGNTGWVYVWHPGGALKKLANSDSPFPNGITASPDGSTLFVDIYMANEVRRYATASGKLTGSAHIEHADNVSWSDHDTLLVASHIAGLSRMNSCGRVEKGACSARFQIVELDPKTLATRVVVDREGAPMGAATVAIPLGDYLYLGSYKSDRMLRIPRKR